MWSLNIAQAALVAVAVGIPATLADVDNEPSGTKFVSVDYVEEHRLVYSDPPYRSVTTGRWAQPLSYTPHAYDPVGLYSLPTRLSR